MNWHDNLFKPFAFDDENSGYANGKRFWKSATLYAAAKEQECKPYKFYLKYLDMSDRRWNCHRIVDIVNCCSRVMKADPDIPIVLSPVGGILDGYHRIVKALMERRTFVMALRLKDMPEPDEVEE